MSNWRFTRAEVSELCHRYGFLLHLKGMVGADGKPLEGERVMWAFALNESIHIPAVPLPDIFSAPPRFEKAYFTGGRYAKDAHQATLNAQYGQDGAKSYGCWQVMLVNAKGFAPHEFERCEPGGLAFIGFCNRLIDAQHPSTLSDLGDAYNSGNFKDHNVPVEYIERLLKHYAVPLPAKIEVQGVAV